MEKWSILTLCVSELRELLLHRLVCGPPAMADFPKSRLKTGAFGARLAEDKVDLNESPPLLPAG